MRVGEGTKYQKYEAKKRLLLCDFSLRVTSLKNNLVMATATQLYYTATQLYYTALWFNLSACRQSGLTTPTPGVSVSMNGIDLWPVRNESINTVFILYSCGEHQSRVCCSPHGTGNGGTRVSHRNKTITNRDIQAPCLYMESNSFILKY